MKPFKKVKRIHFVGIGGAGMIGIAKVLLQKGYKISGSDISDSKDLKKIRKDGAKIYIGHSKKNIVGANLLVVSSAINKKNPELLQAKKESITVIPRAEMLGSLMIGYESIAVAGSHGKTTTTSMIAKIFSIANLSPTYVVGGKVLSTDENSDLGDGKYIVVEADESDGSFIHLQPDVAVLTNIDDDHLTHFNNIFENLLDSFILFAENVPFYGYMVINGDDKNIKKISKRISRPKITFGVTNNCDYQIVSISPKEGKQEFKIIDKKKKKTYKFHINLPGKHNIYNAAASITVSLEEGIPITKIKKAINEFTGVGRRYEKHNIMLGSKRITLIDDYGHHPLEIDSNIKAIREEYKNRKVCMIFQPHRFSRTAQLFDYFIRVLRKTDILILLDIYSASERPIKGVNSRVILETLKQKGLKDVTYLKNHNEVIDLIIQKKDSFDILVTQGAGSISKVCEVIKDKCKT